MSIDDTEQSTPDDSTPEQAARNPAQTASEPSSARRPAVVLLPAPELIEQLYERLVDRPYARIVQWLRARYDTVDDDPPDLYPIALILTQTMSAYRSLRETFGRVPHNVDDERYITAWVDVALAVAARYGLD